MFPLYIIVVISLNKNFFISDASALSDLNNTRTTEHNELPRNGGEKEKLKIAKCCPQNEAVFINFSTLLLSCNEYTSNVTQFNELPVYDNNILYKQLDVAFSNIFRILPDLAPAEERLSESYLALGGAMNTYLKEDGMLHLEFPNAYDRWIKINRTSYCVDYMVDENNTFVDNNLQFFCNLPDEQPKVASTFFKIALLISAVFLFLVLVVYMLLPNLRNLCGMILMAYVFSLMLAFICLSSMQLQELQSEECVRLTTATYFFFLASFCWMNVMSFDIWWTFRGYAKARPIHRRGETFKFLMYSIYGFGVPLAMAIFFEIINRSDLKHKPWIVKPLVPEAGCFIEGGQKLVYLYVPMLILILCNWVFFFMTAFNIWRLHRNTSMLDSPAAGTPAAHRNQRTRFFIYLKLSIIMGINWILEVVSSVTPDYQFWFITDSYNLFIGLAIFLIFVCKKKIFKQLHHQIHGFIDKRSKPQRSITKSQTSCTTLSNSSQDTPLKVYHHPKGPADSR